MYIYKYMEVCAMLYNLILETELSGHELGHYDGDGAFFIFI